MVDRVRNPNSTALMTTLTSWSVERTRRITPCTLDAIFAALIEAARVHPEATITVDYSPYGVEVQAFEPGSDDAEGLLFHRAWHYDYPE